LPLNLNKKIN